MAGCKGNAFECHTIEDRMCVCVNACVSSTHSEFSLFFISIDILIPSECNGNVQFISISSFFVSSSVTWFFIGARVSFALTQCWKKKQTKCRWSRKWRSIFVNIDCIILSSSTSLYWCIVFISRSFKSFKVHRFQFIIKIGITLSLKQKKKSFSISISMSSFVLCVRSFLSPFDHFLYFFSFSKTFTV